MFEIFENIFDGRIIKFSCNFLVLTERIWLLREIFKQYLYRDLLHLKISFKSFISSFMSRILFLKEIFEMCSEGFSNVLCIIFTLKICTYYLEKIYPKDIGVAFICNLNRYYYMNSFNGRRIPGIAKFRSPSIRSFVYPLVITRQGKSKEKLLIKQQLPLKTIRRETRLWFILKRKIGISLIMKSDQIRLLNNTVLIKKLN